MCVYIYIYIYMFDKGGCLGGLSRLLSARLFDVFLEMDAQSSEDFSALPSISQLPFRSPEATASRILGRSVGGAPAGPAATFLARKVATV